MLKKTSKDEASLKTNVQRELEQLEMKGIGEYDKALDILAERMGIGTNMLYKKRIASWGSTIGFTSDELLIVANYCEIEPGTLLKEAPSIEMVFKKRKVQAA